MLHGCVCGPKKGIVEEVRVNLVKFIIHFHGFVLENGEEELALHYEKDLLYHESKATLVM